MCNLQNTAKCRMQKKSGGNFGELLCTWHIEIETQYQALCANSGLEVTICHCHKILLLFITKEIR